MVKKHIQPMTTSEVSIGTSNYIFTSYPLVEIDDHWDTDVPVNFIDNSTNFRFMCGNGSAVSSHKLIT